MLKMLSLPMFPVLFALISNTCGTTDLPVCDDLIADCLRKEAYPEENRSTRDKGRGIPQDFFISLCREKLSEIKCAETITSCDSKWGRKSEIERNAELTRSFCSRLPALSTLVPCMNNQQLKKKYTEISKNTMANIKDIEDSTERCGLFKSFISETYKAMKAHCNIVGVQAVVEYTKEYLAEKRHRTIFDLPEGTITDNCAEEVKVILNTFKYKRSSLQDVLL